MSSAHHETHFVTNINEVENIRVFILHSSVNSVRNKDLTLISSLYGHIRDV